MLSSKLLRSSTGSGAFTPPVQEHEMTMVAYLTRLSNLVINDDTAFSWSDALVMDPAYCSWDSGTDATKLNILADGWYWVGGDFTTLGTSYGGANNTNWLAGVGRNGIDLAHMIVLERHQSVGATSADLMSIGSPVYLEAGDYLQVFFQNTNASNILVESNPSDGPDYTTDTGPGTMSPHLFLIAMNGDPPA